MTDAPLNREVEWATLGACLLSADALAHAIHTVRVRPQHFFSPKLAAVFSAMCDLEQGGDGVDVVTLAHRLRERGELDLVGGPAAIDSLAGVVPVVGNIDRYCRDVVRLHRWRERHMAALNAKLAVDALDDKAWDQALADAQAVDTDRLGGRWLSGPDQSLQFAKTLNGEHVHRWTWGIPRLDQLTRGGARRGQITLIAGPTSHGKSAFADQTLDAMGQHGAKVGLFINEMTHAERIERVAARRSGFDLDLVQAATSGRHEFTPAQRARLIASIHSSPVEIRECSGWAASDICREARRRDLDVVCLDIIQRLPHRGDQRTRDLEDASLQFDKLAKEGRHVVVLAHINRARVNHDGTIPVPVPSDIRDCMGLVNDADNVLMVWREQDSQTLQPTESGLIRLAKCRGGELGGVPVRFDGSHQQFVPIDRRLEVAA